MSSIKTWSEDDRPREKFCSKGKSVLSDAELLAILLRSGTGKINALEVGRQLLQAANGDLNKLAKSSIKQLCDIPGIGKVKAITILAALELGGRKQAFESISTSKISGSQDAYQQVKHLLEDLEHEEFWILNLSRNNTIINLICISKGGISGTVVDPKIIFNKALEVKSSGIILFHNHPSGNLQPSSQDIALTQKIQQAGQLLDIQVLDHIIVAGKRYYSFADEGNM
jgi:DNA repair protein RadC